MQHNSTAYIVSFSAAVCLVCSLFVSSAAVFLKERQQANRLLDKQQKVLAIAGLTEEGAALSSSEVQKIFNERIETRFVDMRKDAVAGPEDAPDPATYNQRKAANNPQQSAAVAPNPAQVKRVPDYIPVYYVYNKEKSLEMVVLPVEGMGLWGVMYGFLALDKDARTIRGVTFYEHKETPGLGAEVDNPRWKALWPGRKAYDDGWVAKIEVIKGQAGPPEDTPHQVSGLTGATITSNGVTNLLRFWLGEEGYGPYLASLREEGSDG